LLAGALGAVAILHADRDSAACIPDLVDLRVTGCSTVAVDTAAAESPLPIWGAIDCVDPRVSGKRHQLRSGGGDPHLMGDGTAQPDNVSERFSFRRMTLQDSDEEQWHNGQRCELGKNDYRTADTPQGDRLQTILYREGERRVTFLSVRLPSRFFDLRQTGTNFQIPMQMKGTQPSDGSGGNPALALHAFDQDGDGDGEWVLHRDHPNPNRSTLPLWCARAELDTWTRFAFDIRYTQDPSVGSVKVYADLNGDGAATLNPDDDPECDEESPGDPLIDEQSRTITAPTLTVETPDSSIPDDDPLEPGDSIPSHLRVGLYQSTSAACPGPPGPGPGTGRRCSVDIDNVQVFALEP
jgi:hypothetical protein